MRALVIVVVLGCAGPHPIENRTAPRSPAITSQTRPAGEGRQIRRTSVDGIIQLEGDREAASESALLLMTEHCGGVNRLTIIQEGEEAIETRPDGKIVTAWRIHYACDR